MSKYTVQTIVADSNGYLANLPSDFFLSPVQQSVQIADRSAKYAEGDWYAVSPDSTGVIYVEFLDRGNAAISDQVLLFPGVVINISASVVRPLAVVRGGIVTILSGKGTPPVFGPVNTHLQRSTGFLASASAGVQIPYVPGGPLSPIWCSPLSAPSQPILTARFAGAALDLEHVKGHISGPVLGAGIPNFLHWRDLTLVAFAVDPQSQNVLDVRPLFDYLENKSFGASINPWDRLGIYATPSAANPDPNLAPEGNFSIQGAALGYFNRFKGAYGSSIGLYPAV